MSTQCRYTNMCQVARPLKTWDTSWDEWRTPLHSKGRTISRKTYNKSFLTSTIFLLSSSTWSRSWGKPSHPHRWTEISAAGTASTDHLLQLLVDIDRRLQTLERQDRELRMQEQEELERDTHEIVEGVKALPIWILYCLLPVVYYVPIASFNSRKTISLTWKDMKHQHT